MKKLILNNLIKEPYLSRNGKVFKMYSTPEAICNDIMLCGGEHSGILIEQSLEDVLSYSGIDLLIGNKELTILTQNNEFFKVRNLYNKDGSDCIDQHLDFNSLEKISYGNRPAYIETSDGVTFDCLPTVDDCIKAIEEEHRAHDVIIGENIESIKIHGLTIPEVVRVYAILYGRYEEDRVIRIAEGEEIDLRYE